MRLISSTVAMLAAIAGSTATARPDPASTQPGWMAGCWEQASGTQWTEECWMGARGGIMLGAGRSGVGENLRDWEATQILAGPDGKLAYWASPDGGARVSFPMVSQGPKEIVFANPAHDYPQRIRYWLDGETLNAEISLIDGSNAMRWSYRRTQ
uniref:DUF6265 family protein n=1 Tax=Sphingomonas bacterium TaxID=1895847 RepID=UPI002605B3AB|nr:DUF6265 family protein [Sphingomonas bacterium]